MRFTPTFIACCLTLGIASSWAKPTSPDPIPKITLISILDSGQLLIKDEDAGEYVLKRVGEVLHGLKVTEVGKKWIVLSGLNSPERTKYLLRVRERPILAGKIEPTADVRTIESSGLELLDPYLTRPVKSVSAPAGQRASESLSTAESKSEHRGASQKQKRSASSSKPSPARNHSYTIHRDEFNSTFADFHRVAREIQVEQVPGGIRIRGLSRGSLFYRLGVRKGDIVQSIAGIKMKGVDDGALAYARVLSKDTFAVKVMRGKTLITLRYQFSPQ